jgi:hypothetical protein
LSRLSSIGIDVYTYPPLFAGEYSRMSVAPCPQYKSLVRPLIRLAIRQLAAVAHVRNVVQV